MSRFGQGTPGAALLGPVGHQVARRLADVTRFDAQDLLPQGPEVPLRAKLTLDVLQDVVFSSSAEQGTGPLPAGVTPVRGDTLAALGPALRAAQQALEGQVHASLESWARAGGGRYRRLLAGVSELGLADRTLGCEVACRPCSGQGRLTCNACWGQGHTPCHACGSSGEQRCGRCVGSGTSQCTGCHGSGTRWETVSESVWNGSTNSYHQESRQVSRLCFTCGGSGRETCAGCGGRRNVRCMTCHGRRQLDCGTCGTSGRIGCQECRSTGRLHAVGRVHGSVRLSEALHVSCPDPALAPLLKERAELARLPDYGRVTGATHGVAGAGVTSRYHLEVDAARATLEVSDARGARPGRFVLYGFGPAAEVLDHGHLEGHVLGGDLEALEAELATARRWRPLPPTLLARLAEFVASELNLLILQRVAGRKAAAPAVLSEVEAHFAGMVDEPYIARAVQALRRSFALVAWALLWKRAAALAAGGALVLGVVMALPPAPQVAWAVLAGGLLAAVGGWVALEAWAGRRVKAIFGDDSGPRVLQELRASGAFVPLRAGAALGLLAGTPAVQWGVTALRELLRRNGIL